jgi:hypothetical protein
MILYIFLAIIFTMQCVTLGLLWDWRRKQLLHVSYLIDKVDDTQNKIGILGKVLKIFEEETQILQRRNEQLNIKQRFNREPR